MENETKKKIAIIGGGPAGLFVMKRLLDSGRKDVEITVYEKSARLGAGMPYSEAGAAEEHVTNVSDKEIPELVTSIKDWLHHAPHESWKRFGFAPERFNEDKVVPRLLFGDYLEAQFESLLLRAKKNGIEVSVYRNTAVMDAEDESGKDLVKVTTDTAGYDRFHHVVICTGHRWPAPQEAVVPGWFDSPYPPSKLRFRANHPVALKGASLTALDAVRTLARQHGRFDKNSDGNLQYHLNEDAPDFRLVLHSINGLLPAVRFHLYDPGLAKDFLIGEEELQNVKAANDGFVPLDYLFERNFKQPLRERHPEFYAQVKDLSLEEFVTQMMELRERLDAFTLFRAEVAEAEKSIRRRQPVYWKEMLGVLSFAMNYPAKHFPAEDMLRLKKVLMPLISIVIASVPQSSCRELLALHEAGVLGLVSVDAGSSVEPMPEGGAVYRYNNEEGEAQEVRYKTFVNCVGQPQFMAKEFPFKTLLDKGSVSPARLRFRSAKEGEKLSQNVAANVEQDAQGGWWLNLPGITINDKFQVLDVFGAYNPRIYMMAVPYIGGYNPDYSGLDFCEEASERVVKAMLEE